MPARGPRQRVTVRLPYDEYREAAVRARQRGWSFSDYVGYCVAKELGVARGSRRGTGGGTRSHHPLSPHTARVIRDFDESADA